MITSLLVPVDSSVHAQAALEHAVAMGKTYGARLTGLYVLDIRYLEMPPYLDYSYTFEAMPPTLAPIEVMDRFRVKSERLLNDLRESAGRAGLLVDTRTEEGVPSQIIADLGGAHDLIVMGKRGEHAKWGRDFLGSTAESVIRRSASPVFLAEGGYRPLRTALVLFDASHPANRALKLAADLGLRAGIDLKVLTVDDDVTRGEATLAEARAYLDPLRLRADYIHEPGREVRVTTEVLDHDPADLLVLGMRGHSALHKLILGSTAEHLMRTVELPILLVP